MRLAYFCSYVPVELATAAGMRPVRVRGASLGAAGDRFPSTFCPFVRAAAATVLDDPDRFAAAVVTNSCDAMERLHDVLRSHWPRPTLLLEVPRRNTRTAVEFFAARLVRFASELSAVSGYRGDLGDAIRLWDERRRLLKAIWQLTGKGRLRHGAEAQRRILDREEDLPPDEINHLLAMLTREAVPGGPEGRRFPRLMVAGNSTYPPDLLDTLGALGASVVSAWTCEAGRDAVGPIGDAPEGAIGRIAQAYLGRPRCPRMADWHGLAQHLESSLADVEPDGVVYFATQFCSPHGYAYAAFREVADRLGVPSLRLEGGGSTGLQEQDRTRLQGFVESLTDRNPGPEADRA